MSCVLVCAAHPDDEILGCGGAIARHTAEGDTVHILIMAEGATSRDGAEKGDVDGLRQAAAKAAAVLGAEAPVFAQLPDNRMDGVDLLDVIKPIEKMIAEIRPQVIYTHHHGDLNVDHRITHQAVLTACRPQPGADVTALYAFETVSSTEWSSGDKETVFQPSRYVDISAQLKTKLSALECYETEMRPFPHARSLENVEALARTRGAAAGLEAAEAFMIIREVVR